MSRWQLTLEEIRELDERFGDRSWQAIDASLLRLMLHPEQARDSRPSERDAPYAGLLPEERR